MRPMTSQCHQSIGRIVVDKKPLGRKGSGRGDSQSCDHARACRKAPGLPLSDSWRALRSRGRLGRASVADRRISPRLLGPSHFIPAPPQCSCDLARVRGAGVAAVVPARWAQHLPKRMGALASIAASRVWPVRAWHAMLVITSAFTIAAAAIVIDVYQWSNALPLWVDEETIALNVRDRSLRDLSGALWLGQSAPFGWLVLERMAMATIGTSEAAVRAVPLLFGIATVGAAAWVGRRWMGRVGAAVFVLLCWISPYLSHYRFEVKHYTPISCSACFSRRSPPGRSSRTAHRTGRDVSGSGGWPLPPATGLRTARCS